MKSKRQQGSALVETSLLMFVLLPLVLALAMMGNLIDVKQSAIQASRYATWESTVHTSSPTQQQAKTAERFFAKKDASLSSYAQDAGVNRLWGASPALTDTSTTNENHSSQAPDRQSENSEAFLQVDKSSVSTGYQFNQSNGGVALLAGQTLGNSGELLDGLKGNEWGLTSDGLTAATVIVEIKGSDWLMPESASCTDGQATCLQAKGAILVDSWQASTEEQAKRRVRSLVPASALQPLGDALSLVGKLPLFGELEDLKGAFGHVDMGVLPEYAKP